MAQIRASISFFWACRRSGGNHVTFEHAIKCRRAVGLSVPMSGSYYKWCLTVSPFGQISKDTHRFPRQPFPLQSLTQARRTLFPFRGEQRTNSSHGSPTPQFSRAPSPF